MEESGEISVGTLETTEISLALPSLQAVALAHFVKRVDFETIASMSSVSVVSDGKSEADLIWFALIELRSALAAGVASPAKASGAATPEPGQSRTNVLRLRRKVSKGSSGA
jgi:hypothetical protein